LGEFLKDTRIEIEPVSPLAVARTRWILFDNKFKRVNGGLNSYPERSTELPMNPDRVWEAILKRINPEKPDQKKAST